MNPTDQYTRSFALPKGREAFITPKCSTLSNVFLLSRNSYLSFLPLATGLMVSLLATDVEAAARALPVTDESASEASESSTTPASSTPLKAEKKENNREQAYTGRPINPSLPIEVRILAPRPREVVEDNAVDLFLDVENYQLAPDSKRGNRLHVVVNNQPPFAVNDIARPVILKNLSDGGHTVRVYAVNPKGIRLRKGQSFAMTRFFVKRKSLQNQPDPNMPYLNVNLPTGDTVQLDEKGRVAFDYWVANLPRGQKGLGNYRVHYRLDNYEGILEQDGPVFWSNLPPGKHNLVVELFDLDGRPAFGPFNRIQRIFEVKRIMKALPILDEEEEDEELQELLRPPTPTNDGEGDFVDGQ